MSLEPPRSIHQQIAAALRAEIASGTYAPGSALPAEPELATTYGVSRGTINRAVTELRREHLVEIRRGVGTFVTADDVVRCNVDLPRPLWTQIADAANRDEVPVDGWIVAACRERLTRDDP